MHNATSPLTITAADWDRRLDRALDAIDGIDFTPTETIALAALLETVIARAKADGAIPAPAPRPLALVR